MYGQFTNDPLPQAEQATLQEPHADVQDIPNITPLLPAFSCPSRSESMECKNSTTITTETSNVSTDVEMPGHTTYGSCHSKIDRHQLITQKIQTTLLQQPGNINRDRSLCPLHKASKRERYSQQYKGAVGPARTATYTCNALYSMPESIHHPAYSSQHQTVWGSRQPLIDQDYILRGHYAMSDPEHMPLGMAMGPSHPANTPLGMEQTGNDILVSDPDQLSQKSHVNNIRPSLTKANPGMPKDAGVTSPAVVVESSQGGFISPVGCRTQGQITGNMGTSQSRGYAPNL